MLRLASLLAAFAVSAAHAAPVSLKAQDGTSLSAEHTGKGSRGVVLVHGSAADRSGWAPLVKRMDGVQVLALDLRGHGASKGAHDPVAAVDDVGAAVRWLRGRGAAEVVVIGAGMGGNLALAASAADPAIESVVMLSPSLNAGGVKASASLGALGQRPLLLVAGSDDALSLKAANLIADHAPSAQVQVMPNGGSALAMLHRDTDLQGTLVAWARGDYGAANGDVAPRASTQADMGEVKTTGTKLGEKRP